MSVQFFSNNKSGNEAVIYVDTVDTASKHNDTVCQWIAKASKSYVVGGAQYNDFVDEDEDHPRYKKVMNRLVVAVHAGWHAFFDAETEHDELIVTEKIPSPLNATSLMEAMKADAPSCVKAVGVNVVSEKYIKYVWAEIIGKNRNWMDDHPEGAKTGYMVYPMWLWSTQTDTMMCMRETSCNYDWTDWPAGYLSQEEL